MTATATLEKTAKIIEKQPKITPRAAILDMYAGESNRGMGMIRKAVEAFEGVEMEVFDVRKGHQIPRAESFDLFIFSGGPGDPRIGEPEWEGRFFDLIEAIDEHNRSDAERKKYVLFICHSFQMACLHFGLGTISERERMSFGTYPTHKTAAGKREQTFAGLADDFFVADFRNFQVIQPRPEAFKKIGAEVLCLEKYRPHVVHERALMAVRFSPEMIGTQFHPEADPEGMAFHFSQPERRAYFIQHHGEPRYFRTMNDLGDPAKIAKTHATVIPNFLRQSLEKLENQ